MIQMKVQGILNHNILSNNAYLDISLGKSNVVDVAAKCCVVQIASINSYKNNGIRKNVFMSKHWKLAPRLQNLIPCY